jgi:CheY-like chemotaxis protein
VAGGAGGLNEMLEKSLPAEAGQVQACQARRMEIVGELTGGALHDFNNILTVISGTIDLLAEAVADRPDLAAIAGLIGEAAARGAVLTSNLLAFARGQPSQPRNVDVALLLGDAARLLQPTLGEAIEISSKPGDDVPPVLADRCLLMTAILNLAIMARDAMPGGGKLGFEARRVAEDCAGDDPAISPGDLVMIVVSASGHGAIAAQPEQVFAETGMIDDFIRQSGGHIEVGSDAGRGMSVKLYLPLVAAAAQAPVQGSGEGGDEAVLIVEDDALVRRFVVDQVQSLGYRVLAAGNASEAMALIDEGGEIDLLFTDVMMPGSMNGRQLAVEALNRRPSLKVLYTSGYAENVMVRNGCLDAGVLLLAKPYRRADLARMIRVALAA